LREPCLNVLRIHSFGSKEEKKKKKKKKKEEEEEEAIHTVET
jgi:hypothetical protein